MYRRTPSVLALALVLLLAGCMGATVATEGNPEPHTTDPGDATRVSQPNERSPVPRDLPDAPDTITAENVGAFVAAHEEVRMHNGLVRENSNLVSLGTSCEVDSVESVGRSYAVTVECGHWYEFADGDRRGIADGAPYTVDYTVGAEGAVSHGEREPVF